jgi:predicted esterase
MRVLGKGVIVSALLGLCVGSSAEPRTWTSRDGKTAVAEFQDLEGDTLVLKKGSKTLRLPLAGFSDEDQAYARREAEEARRRAEEEKARREKLQSLLGLRSSVPITARRWDQWEDYYKNSLCGMKMMDFFAEERSIVDVRDKGVFISTEEVVRPPNYSPSMISYCPSDYDGEEKLGVYIHIYASNKAKPPNSGYQEMMDKYRLVYASPFKAGNSQADMRRCALALDTLAQLRKDYTIDENRIYIGGTSGGGAMSTFVTFLYPEDFRAALNSVRWFKIESEVCLPFVDDKDIRTASGYKQPFAFISGPEDSNYRSMPASEQSFKRHGFTVKFFDISGMKHETASAETFDEVMEWVEEMNPRL